MLTVLLATLLTGLPADHHEAVKPAADQPRKLFNGKDLTGWKWSRQDEVPVEKVWTVKDGVLRTSGNPAGYLYTDAKHKDYQLTLEWRFPEKGGNNGVLVHGSQPDVLGPWPKSLEAQLQSGEAGDIWVIGTTIALPGEGDQSGRIAGRRHRNLTDGSEKPLGEWNRYRVVAKGDTVKLYVNGDLVNEAEDVSVSEGFIALQSEGTPVEFRNIQLVGLKDAE